MADNVFQFIKEEEKAFKTRSVYLADGWEWNMHEHIRRSFLYKNSKFTTGANDGSRPNRNIILPMVRVSYRSEGFDVTDIVPFVNDAEEHHKSFIVKKFHPHWARDNDIDTFIDELVESYVDYGLALVKNIGDVRPEVVPLQRLAFCDQSDILSGPICEKHYISPSEAREQKNWENVDKAIQLSLRERGGQQQNKTKTPGKYLEVYELHGDLPEAWLERKGASYKTADSFVPQMHVVAFYKDDDGNKKGITLFSEEEPDPIYKAIKRDPIYGRACGLGGIEELFEPQVWVNYSEIQIKEMLDVASKILVQTADKKFANENKITELEQGQILYNSQKGEEIRQVNLQPINKTHFDNLTQAWEDNARTLASADEALLGEQPPSGTPFRLQALITQEGKGIHDYRRGKIATFVQEIYRDWAMDFLVKEINKGQRWREELNPDELQELAEKVVISRSNQRVKDALLKGETITREDRDIFEQIVRDNFLSGGEKKFIEAVEKELKDIPVDVFVNVAGKQKDLADRADKLTNIFRQVIQAPQVLQSPGMAKLFNQILEASGFSPVNFNEFTRTAQPAADEVPGAQQQEAETLEEEANLQPANA